MNFIKLFQENGVTINVGLGMLSVFLFNYFGEKKLDGDDVAFLIGGMSSVARILQIYLNRKFPESKMENQK